MRTAPYIKRLAAIFMVPPLLFFLSGCMSISAPLVTKTEPPTHFIQAPVGLKVPVCHLSACTNFNPVKGTIPFTDTWDNVHSFLVFDYHVKDPMAVANDYDFVWGAGVDHLPLYRSANPHIMLSYYMTVHRDDGTFSETQLGNQGRLGY